MTGVTCGHTSNTRKTLTPGFSFSSSSDLEASCNPHSYSSPHPSDTPHLISPDPQPSFLCPTLLPPYSASAPVHIPPQSVASLSSQQPNYHRSHIQASTSEGSRTQTHPPLSSSKPEPMSSIVNPSFSTSSTSATKPSSPLLDSSHNKSLSSSTPYIAASPSSSTCPVHSPISSPSIQHSFPTMLHPTNLTPASEHHHHLHISVHPTTPVEATPILPGASPRFLQIMEGMTQPGDSGNPVEPPPWLDRELFNRGRSFYHRYLFCLSFSNLLSLVMMMSIKGALQPLIYTGKSDTPNKALRRYMSTFLHLITWYKGDVWDTNDPAHKDLLSVRKTHAKIAHNANTKDYEKIQTISVVDKGHKEPKSALHPAISKDFSAATKFTLPETDLNSPQLFLNQMDMSMTQYAFMGLIVAHPDKLGAASATEEDFEGLIHFWRGLGWLLGIEDKFNLCSGTVQETRELCLEVEKLLGIPGLAGATWNYEHMTSCIMNGLSYVLHILSYPAMLRYLAYTIDVPIPSVVKHINLWHTCKYWMMRLVFGIISLVPWSLTELNRNLDALMERMKTSSKLKLSAYRSESVSTTKTISTCPFWGTHITKAPSTGVDSVLHTH